MPFSSNIENMYCCSFMLREGGRQSLLAETQYTLTFSDKNGKHGKHRHTWHPPPRTKAAANYLANHTCDSQTAKLQVSGYHAATAIRGHSPCHSSHRTTFCFCPALPLAVQPSPAVDAKTIADLGAPRHCKRLKHKRNRIHWIVYLWVGVFA